MLLQRLRVQPFMTPLAYRDQLSFSGVRIMQRQRQVRSILKMLDVMHDERASHRSAHHALIMIHLSHCLRQSFPCFRVVEAQRLIGWVEVHSFTDFSPVRFSQRRIITSTNFGSYSMVYPILPFCSAATIAVPEPPNRSSTRSPGFDEHCIR